MSRRVIDLKKMLWPAADYEVPLPEVLFRPAEMPAGFRSYQQSYRLEILLWLWDMQINMPEAYKREATSMVQFKDCDRPQRINAIFDALHAHVRLGHCGRIEGFVEPAWVPTLSVIDRDGRPNPERAEHIRQRIHERMGLDRGTPFWFVRTGHQLRLTFRTLRDDPHEITAVPPPSSYTPNPEDAFLPWEAMAHRGDGSSHLAVEYQHAGLTYETPEYVDTVRICRLLELFNGVFEFCVPGERWKGNAWRGIPFDFPQERLIPWERSFLTDKWESATEQQGYCYSETGPIARVIQATNPIGGFYIHAKHPSPFVSRLNWSNDPEVVVGDAFSYPRWHYERGSWQGVVFDKYRALRDQRGFTAPSLAPSMPWNQAAIVDADYTSEPVRFTNEILRMHGCDWRVDKTLISVRQAEDYVRSWAQRIGAYGLHFLVVQRDGLSVRIRTRNWWCDPLPDLATWTTLYNVPDIRVPKTRLYDPRRDSPALLPPLKRIHMRSGKLDMNASQTWWRGDGDIII